MPKQIRNFQELEINGRTLNSKEIRLLRKFAGIAGRRLIYEVARSESHKHRTFVLELWNAYENGGLRRTKAFNEVLCDVAPGTFDEWYIPQGLQQKRTFRLNKFHDNMCIVKVTMANGEWQGLKSVYKVTTNIANDSHWSYRLEKMHSYIVANNRSEAVSVWATMVLAPLGLVDITRFGSYRNCDASFYGPEQYCNLAKLNADARMSISSEIEKAEERILDSKAQLESIKKNAELAFALSTSTLMATNG